MICIVEFFEELSNFRSRFGIWWNDGFCGNYLLTYFYLSLVLEVLAQGSLTL